MRANPPSFCEQTHRHCERSEAIQWPYEMLERSLLRRYAPCNDGVFARNDGIGESKLIKILLENKEMILYVLMLALIIVVFNLTVPLLAGLYIVSELGGNSFQTSYGVTFFCLGNIVGLPFGNPAHTQLGPISLFVLCLILMGFCSWHCAVATNYFSFVLFRFFEGVASGPLLILVSYTLIPLLAPEKDPRFVFSLFLATFTFIPSFSGAYGYWIAYYYTWRFPFYS